MINPLPMADVEVWVRQRDVVRLRMQMVQAHLNRLQALDRALTAKIGDAPVSSPSAPQPTQFSIPTRAAWRWR